MSKSHGVCDIELGVDWRTLMKLIYFAQQQETGLSEKTTNTEAETCFL